MGQPTAIAGGLVVSALGSLLLVGANLPLVMTANLLLAARAAFTDGVQLTGVVAAVIFVALAVLVCVMRPTGPSTDLAPGGGAQPPTDAVRSPVAAGASADGDDARPRR